jgi:hypothetical protein
MGNGAIRRYMGGKRPEKFFREDLWPTHRELCTKLGMDLNRCLQIFNIFCKIDTDESGSVDVDEAFAYMGGQRTRFTERIFDVKDKVNAKEGLSFGPFSIVLWNFCSFSPALVARYIFEIYDVDNNKRLERPDIESMYKMMYDCDDSELSVIKRFPFDDEDIISKDDFIKHCVHRKNIIKPALDYQKRLRRCLGGGSMWDGLTKYRDRWFKVYDDQSNTLDDALHAILEADNPNPTIDESVSDIIEEKKRQLEEQMEEAKLALKRRQIQMQAALKVKVNPEQRKEIRLKTKFEEGYKAFGLKRFTVDDIWERKEMRDELFSLFDKYYSCKDKNREDANQNSIILTDGDAEDHEARYQDYIVTTAGAHEFDRRMLREICIVLQQRYPSRDTMTVNEAKRISKIIEALAKLSKLEKNEAALIKKARDATDSNPSIDISAEKLFAQQTAKKSDFTAAEKKVHEELRTAIMERAKQVSESPL